MRMPQRAPHRSRIILVEDHPLSRIGLSQLINQEPDLLVCGHAGDLAESNSLIERTRPDLAIVDISLPGGSGIDLIRDLKTRLPDLRFLVLSMHDESLYAERAFHAGASGYLTKQEAPDVILTAIRRILDGDIYLGPGAAARLIAGGATPLGSLAPEHVLSDRELELLRLLGEGRPAKEAAASMGISVSTAYSYRERIKEKMRLKGGVDLLLTAARWVQGRR